MNYPKTWTFPSYYAPDYSNAASNKFGNIVTLWEQSSEKLILFLEGKHFHCKALVKFDTSCCPTAMTVTSLLWLALTHHSSNNSLGSFTGTNCLTTRIRTKGFLDPPRFFTHTDIPSRARVYNQRCLFFVLIASVFRLVIGFENIWSTSLCNVVVWIWNILNVCLPDGCSVYVRVHACMCTHVTVGGSQLLCDP